MEQKPEIIRRVDATFVLFLVLFYLGNILIGSSPKKIIIIIIIETFNMPKIKSCPN
jgi:hypothetical protein